MSTKPYVQCKLSSIMDSDNMFPVAGQSTTNEGITFKGEFKALVTN